LSELPYRSLARAFTSTAPARSTIQASACRQLLSPKLTKKVGTHQKIAIYAGALRRIACHLCHDCSCTQ